jgi:hypothetical protein
MYARRSTSGFLVQLEPDSTQYWLVHRTRVDVPSMYRPRGRYRYTHGIVSPSATLIHLISLKKVRRTGALPLLW